MPLSSVGYWAPTANQTHVGPEKTAVTLIALVAELIASELIPSLSRLALPEAIAPGRTADGGFSGYT